MKHTEKETKDFAIFLASEYHLSSHMPEDKKREIANGAYKVWSKELIKKEPVNIILKEVCSYYDITIDSVKIKTRHPDIKEPRQIAQYLAKKYTKYSWRIIGEKIGEQAHATVINSCKRIKDLIFTDKDLRKDIETIEKTLKL